MSQPERPTQRAHRELAAILRDGDLAIDATSGNGHDTLFLANHVGPSGRVIAFDIQQEAIESTRTRLTAAGLADRVALIQGSHATLVAHAAPASAKAAIFNLGYLPGGDHTLITLRDTTLLALDQALTALVPGGLLLIVCYPGHPGGDEESTAVLAWSAKLDPACYTVEVELRENTLRPAPFLVLVKVIG